MCVCIISLWAFFVGRTFGRSAKERWQGLGHNNSLFGSSLQFKKKGPEPLSTHDSPRIHISYIVRHAGTKMERILVNAKSPFYLFTRLIIY